jgi:hypothetical protein
MDATLADAAMNWARLWILAALYLVLAAGATKLSAREGEADARPA